MTRTLMRGCRFCAPVLSRYNPGSMRRQYSGIIAGIYHNLLTINAICLNDYTFYKHISNSGCITAPRKNS